MSVTVHGTWQGDVVYETTSEEFRQIPLMHVSAINTAIELGECVELDPCAGCGDLPGTEAMGDGTKRCAVCCSAAAGSGYDDRTENP